MANLDAPQLEALQKRPVRTCRPGPPEGEEPDPYSPAAIRAHLGADEWLGQGQASPL